MRGIIYRINGISYHVIVTIGIAYHVIKSYYSVLIMYDAMHLLITNFLVFFHILNTRYFNTIDSGYVYVYLYYIEYVFLLYFNHNNIYIYILLNVCDVMSCDHMSCN